MKKYVMVILLAAIFNTSCLVMYAQHKKVVKNTPVKKDHVIAPVKFTPIEFGAPLSVSDVVDVKGTSSEYQSLKNLVETNGVTIVYADSTFRPKEPLRRGDFIVSFNSALDAIKKISDAGGVDNGLINTSDKNPSYAEHVSDIKDIKESSIYYTAAQSLIEQYGIAAPFNKSKLLNPGATMPEGEVYDILKSTLGYNSSGTNPYSTAMTRAKFAMVLNNALNLKLSQVNAQIDTKKESTSDLASQQESMLKQQEKQRKDSIAKATELNRIDALKKEAEAWSKLSESQKRKQLKKQNSK